MKAEFAKAVEKIAKRNKKTIFLTGDLGFNALEGVRESIGKRFINAGVAEQNMIDVAAGMAYTGLEPWVYSIAPFLVLKTIEQIRNDICQKNLPVRLVGAGGGYAYGILGSTHHLLEDIAILSSLPNIKLFIPAYSTDVEPIVKKMNLYKGPSYIRVALSPIKSDSYAPFRHVMKGGKVTVIVLGPLLANALEAIEKIGRKIDVWVVTEIPFDAPEDFYKSILKTKKLMILEEHVLSGGLGQIIMADLGKKAIRTKICHIFSKGYPSKLYGSQQYHLKDNGLDAYGIAGSLNKLLHE